MMKEHRIFEESTAYALSSSLRPRSIDLDEIARWAEMKVVAVTGVRRSGKSSLLMLFAQHVHEKGHKVAYINAEDNRLADPEMLDEVLKWFGDSGYLIIDEVTSAVNWSGWLARNHDMLKGRLKLIVSSSRSGLVQPPKELRGRVRNIEVSPLSFLEFMDFNGFQKQLTTASQGKAEKLLWNYMRYGGFPEASLMSNEQEKMVILNDYFHQILALDVGEAAREEAAATRLFGRYVLSAPYFTASKCLNHFKSVGFKMGKEKILALEHHSQGSYLFFFLSVFGAAIKDRAVHPRKTYPVDTGFLYSVGGIEDKGRLLETMVYLALRRRMHLDEELFYWRDEVRGEVDFLICKGIEVKEAVQVTFEMKDLKTRSREIASLQKCLDQTGCQKGTMITWAERQVPAFEDPRINVVRAIDWLTG